MHCFFTAISGFEYEPAINPKQRTSASGQCQSRGLFNSLSAKQKMQKLQCLPICRGKKNCKQNFNFKIRKSHHLYPIYLNNGRLVHFCYYKCLPSGSYDWTSLVGNVKKKVLRSLPEKSPQILDPEHCDTITKIWKVFFFLFVLELIAVTFSLV